MSILPTFDPTPRPAGSDIQVNTFTTGSQVSPALAALADGGFVVTWTSFGQDGEGWGIFGQRYDATGAAVGDEFKVNTYVTGDQNSSSTAALADGGFLVTWSSNGQDGSGYGVYGQRYDSSGAAIASEFRVSTGTAGDQAASSVAALPDGGFVVTWTSPHQDGGAIFGQRYGSSGAAAGGEFRVSPETAGVRDFSAVAALADGGFVVTWWFVGDILLNEDGIYGQRYDATGAAAGAEFRVSAPSGQANSSIAGLADGGFVVTWESFGQDGAGFGIRGRLYDASGATVRAEFQVNTETAGNQEVPSVAALADGGFLVTWSSNGQDGSGYGVYGQRFDSSGAAIGSELRFNQITVGQQINNGPSSSKWVAQLADGRLVDAWSGSGAEEVFVRIVDLPTAAIGTEGPDTLVGTVGPDHIQALGGGDTVAGLAGPDVLDGGDGSDWLDYRASDAAVFVNLSTCAVSGGHAEGDSIARFEKVHGSAFGDTITGDDGDNFLNGLGGVDTLIGLRGNDVIRGGAGADQMNGGDGIDTLDYKESTAAVVVNLTTGTGSGGEAEGDTFGGFENVYGSAHGDVLTGNGGTNILYGFDGADTLLGVGGNDVISGGAGGDILDGGTGIDWLDYRLSNGGVSANLGTGAVSGAHAQGDTISNFENLYGSNHGDVLVGNGGSNEIHGMDGADTIEGLGGIDTIRGGAGADTMDGGDGIDWLDYRGASGGIAVSLATGFGTVGEAAGDRVSNFEKVYGSAHGDTIVGDGGANFLEGLGGNDTLSGIGGNDTMRGGAGADTMDGGDGIDTIDYKKSSAGVTVNLTTGTGAGGEAHGDTMTGFENVYGSAHGDTITGDGGANSLFGFDGADTILGHGGNDVISGGAGGDSLDGGTGIDWLDYRLSNAGVSVNLGTGATSGGHANGDTIANFENLYGSNFADVLNGDGKANQFRGGAGADIFVFDDALGGGNVDRILDFVVDEDKIRLENAVFTGLATGALASSAFGSNLSGLATDASHRIVYETDTGRLFFDADGTGAATGIHFATLSANLALDSGDFIVV